MMPNMMYGMEGWWLLGMGLMLLFWVAVIALVIWAVQRLFPKEADPKRDQALETLRARYAAGQIDAEAYERTRATLEETPVA
jgi:putative membrane protein